MTIRENHDDNIIVNQIKNTEVKIYNPNNKLIVTTDDQLIYTDILVQIKEKELSGYYLSFKGEKIKIGKNGMLEKYPDGLFDKLTDLMLKLV